MAAEAGGGLLLSEGIILVYEKGSRLKAGGSRSLFRRRAGMAAAEEKSGCGATE